VANRLQPATMARSVSVAWAAYPSDRNARTRPAARAPSPAVSPAGPAPGGPGRPGPAAWGAARAATAASRSERSSGLAGPVSDRCSRRTAPASAASVMTGAANSGMPADAPVRSASRSVSRSGAMWTIR
jgi:hypothetical protein